MFSLQLLTALTFLCTAVPDFHFPFEPPKNFSLFSAQERIVHHPVTTTKQEAQDYFDQGLTLIYAFNHDAAYWSFKRATQSDPNLAMGYWGMALALGSNINMTVTAVREQSAYELIQKAISLSSKVTDNEKAYINALATRYSSDPAFDDTELAKRYYRAMQDLVAQYPDDLDAATLCAESGLDLNAWNQWDYLGNPREGTLQIVSMLESVLKRDPNHLGANHYYIHAIEASRYPERALMSAERLRHMLPNSGHILHMPSHIYILVGDYHTAALCNEQAVQVDRAYIERYGIDGIYPLHYLTHNLYFLSRSYSMEGRFEDAKHAGDELYKFYAPHFTSMPELEYAIPNSLFVLLRFNRWKEVLDIPTLPSEMVVSNVLWHFARGVAWAALGDVAKAEEEQTLFTQGKDKLPLDMGYGYNKASSITTIADLMLKAKIAEAKKNPNQAISLLQQAVAAQDRLRYNEPPDWFFPIRESLGGIYLRQDNYRDAEQTFRQDLDKHPRNGRALFGLLESLRGQNRQDDAFWIEREFKEAWQYATTSLNIESL